MSMTKQQNGDDKYVGIIRTRITKKSLEGLPSAFDTPRGARLRPGKPEDGDI